MRCEVIAIGTELLLGQIVDTNSAWIGEQLAGAGIDSHFQTKVGDNLERIVASIRLALGRSDAVILCGGLGPTQDDITREAVADVMGVRLRRQQPIGERIRAHFQARGRVMADNNLRQADVPEGAAVMDQMPGTAPGLICPVGAKVIYAVPGVPHEMRTMVEGSVLPDLRRRAGVRAVIRSRVLRTWGQTESGIAELLAEHIRTLDATGNPTLAFQASGIEGIKVRITAKATDEARARSMIEDEERRVRAVLGDIVFGTDHETMEAVVLESLRRRGKTLAVAEALTGGLMGARLTTTPGADHVFLGSLVCGTQDRGARLLAVAPGAGVSESAATTMAAGVRRLLDADVGIAAVGVAGPGQEDAEPVGTVHLGVALDDHTHARRVRLPGAGERVRQYAVISLLDLLRRTLSRPS